MIKPIGGQVVVRRTQGSRYWSEARVLVRPDTSPKKEAEGRVEAVGPGRVTRKGVRLPMPVRVGDLVLVDWHAGHEMEEGRVVVVRDDDIALVLEEE